MVEFLSPHIAVYCMLEERGTVLGIGVFLCTNQYLVALLLLFFLVRREDYSIRRNLELL